MDLTTISNYLDQLLEVEAFHDDSMNGLQVENCAKIEKIGLAVDACHEAIEKAAKEQCNLLIVHHGLFWGKELPITDHQYKRISSLIKADMGLYAVHLPLDAHPELGHNAQIAQHLDLTDTEPFAMYHGRPIGIKGKLKILGSCSEIAALLKDRIGACTGLFSFGPAKIHTIGIVAGSATDPALFKELKSQNIDLLITGEPKHGAYHLAREFGLNIFYGSHYITETFGLKALGSHLEKKMSIPTVFIDAPCDF
jgi:dinuclear metal center YbgI/SA1388 family protein